MKYLISILLLCSFLHAAEEPEMMYGQPENSFRARRLAAKYESEIKNGQLRQKTNDALDAIIRLAAYRLRWDGHVDEANQLIKEWEGGYNRMLLDACEYNVSVDEYGNHWVEMGRR